MRRVALAAPLFFLQVQRFSPGGRSAVRRRVSRSARRGQEAKRLVGTFAHHCLNHQLRAQTSFSIMLLHLIVQSMSVQTSVFVAFKKKNIPKTQHYHRGVFKSSNHPHIYLLFAQTSTILDGDHDRYSSWKIPSRSREVRLSAWISLDAAVTDVDGRGQTFIILECILWCFMWFILVLT